MRRAPGRLSTWTSVRLAAVLLAVSGAGAVLPAWAQGPAPTLASARALYAAAAYDDALAMLATLAPAGLDADARLTADRYRVLCLLALGRPLDVDEVVLSMIDRDPDYRLDARETSPRARQAFREARARVLPRAARRRYEQARAHYTRRDFAAAATDFGVVRTLLSDPDIAAPDPASADLARLAADFEELSRAAAATAERTAADARRAADAADAARAAAPADTSVAAPAPVAAPSSPAAPVDPADGIYGPHHRGVVPPVALRQDLRRWIAGVPMPLAGTSLGAVEIVVDDRGEVVDARVVTSVSGFYDAVLLDSARSWRYTPAMKDGRPVPFRRVVELRAR